jgi:hypothetical protein
MDMAGNHRLPIHQTRMVVHRIRRRTAVCLDCPRLAWQLQVWLWMLARGRKSTQQTVDNNHSRERSPANDAQASFTRAQQRVHPAHGTAQSPYAPGQTVRTSLQARFCTVTLSPWVHRCSSPRSHPVDLMETHRLHHHPSERPGGLLAFEAFPCQTRLGDPWYLLP